MKIKLLLLLITTNTLLFSCGGGNPKTQELTYEQAVEFVSKLPSHSSINQYYATIGSWDYSNSRGEGLVLAQNVINSLGYDNTELKCENTGIIAVKQESTMFSLTTDYLSSYKSMIEEEVKSGYLISGEIKYFIKENTLISETTGKMYGDVFGLSHNVLTTVLTLTFRTDNKYELVYREQKDDYEVDKNNFTHGKFKVEYLYGK